tara:strand:+ start:343 stop:534 length:192 start_codon:yes stop_codon:yes gene_type:complete
MKNADKGRKYNKDWERPVILDISPPHTHIATNAPKAPIEDTTKETKESCSLSLLELGTITAIS